MPIRCRADPSPWPTGPACYHHTYHVIDVNSASTHRSLRTTALTSPFISRNSVFLSFTMSSTQLAFVSAFLGKPCLPHRFNSEKYCSRRPGGTVQPVVTACQNGPEPKAVRPSIAIIATAATKEALVEEVEAHGGRGLFGVKAKAYWESMGFLPLFFAGFGVIALAIKLFKVKKGQWQSGPTGINKAVTPQSVITTEEEERELHVFKCGGCGYEIYPARGREFKFFPDSFKCPLCGTPKTEFWDLNDPTDPRNQEEEEGDEGPEQVEEETDVVQQLGPDGNGNGAGTLIPDPDTAAEAPVTDVSDSKGPTASTE